jgi:hypothetical protein
MPNPNLIHPIPVVVQRHNRAKQVMDDEAREPLHGARTSAADVVNIDAQVSWGTRGRVQNEAGGVEEKSDGYILCRTSDLRTKGGPFKRGDKIVTIGTGDNALAVELFITQMDPMGHWPDQGGSSLLKFMFSDRKPFNQTGDL